MPELPEVETVKNSLMDLIIGKKIINVKVNYERIIQNVTTEDFINTLKNETFIDIKRRGKYLIFLLTNTILISHLRMEGKYFLKKHDEEVLKHEHIIFEFVDDELRYHDTRKFGVMYLFKTTNLNEIMKCEPLSKLGLEPFDGDFNNKYLKEKICKLKKPIKSVLLDQTIITGLGNIYVDEVCFMSHINPEELAINLTDKQIDDICITSKEVLQKAILEGGTTIKSFMSSHEISGRFQNELLVHTKEICPICHSNITKIRVGGRGTYLCINCQKKNN